MAGLLMANDILVAQRVNKMSSEYTYFLLLSEVTHVSSAVQGL